MKNSAASVQDKTKNPPKSTIKAAVPKKTKGRGGARPGAGRPKGQGPYGEATKPVRIPVSKIDQVMHYIKKGDMALPLFSNAVAAGFPSRQMIISKGRLI